MNQIVLKKPKKEISKNKLWDLYYNGSLIQGCQGKSYPILMAIKKKLILSKTHSNHLFFPKFHVKY